MARKPKTNVEILEQIRDNASTEYQERVPQAIGTGGNVSDVFTQYPSMRNEFINTLTNQVVNTVIYSKVFDNPLKMLHGGVLEFGQSIEQLFVNMAEVKGFLELEEGDEVKDLIKSATATVKALYVTKNYEYKSKVTISEHQLAGAFRSQNGLSDLINQLTSSIVSGIYYQEFTDMKRAILGHAEGKYLALENAKGTMVETQLTNTVLPGGQTAHVVNIGTHSTEEQKGKAITTAVRSLSGRLKFPSTKYNSAKVKTWSNPEDLVFVTTPEIIASMSVNVLASAFNVSEADLNTRVILVDELPSKVTPSSTDLGTGQTATTKEVYGIVMDKSFIIAKDTINQTRSMDVANGLKTNMWYHKHGIMSTCYFANYVIIAE